MRREVAGAVVFEDPTAYDDVADTLVRLLGQDLVIPATAAAVDTSPQAWLLAVAQPSCPRCQVG